MKSLPRFSYHVILWILLFFILDLIFQKWILIPKNYSKTIAFSIIILGIILDFRRTIK